METQLVRGLCEWLVRRNHLDSNPWDDVPARAAAPTMPQLRALSQQQWALVQEWIAEQVEEAGGEHRRFKRPPERPHAVTPVTHGERLGCYLFMQSLVRDAEQRRLLHEMDLALMQLRARLGEADDQLLSLTAAHHDLLRRWTEA